MARQSSFERLKELERGRLRSGARSYTDDESWRDDAYRYADYRLSNDINSMAPQEDVVEARRHRRRQRVEISRGRNNGSNILAENLLLLVFLIGSIYGLYKLTLYLLTQS